MKIVFYGNCQADALRLVLRQHVPERDMVCVQNYHMIAKQKPVNEKILRDADVFIYQPIDSKHGKYSTDMTVDGNMISHLSDHCLKLSFPYVYNSGLWPLIAPRACDWFEKDYCDRKSDNLNDAHPKNWINMNVITDLKKTGATVDDVLDLYRNRGIDWKYESRFKGNISEMLKREKTTDLKAVKFIETNIRKEKMMVTHNHPTAAVFKHMADQVLNKLNIDEAIDLDKVHYPNPRSVIPRNLAPADDQWLHTSYEQDHFKFEYDADCTHDEHYIPHINYIYKNFN